ncbi:MAG TPA: hypothetical protein DGG95_16070 [Cytophagales bacterium]|jgi:hypothetical protein|nr:hypothetical protein [Cytophagales bacterium]
MKTWNPLDYPEFFEGNCFVYVQGNEADIQKYYDLVKLSKEDQLILYPERAMTFVDTICYRPYVKSVITENPWVISCYPYEKVWIIRDGEWKNPSNQTYGASVNIISMNILGVDSTIPLLVLSGKKGIEEYRKKVCKNNHRY